MFYTVYKITNNVNGKFYIGCHKTEDLNDDYMGSGTILKRAIKKHGLENFSKEILHVYGTAEEMFAKEKELVYVSEETYNLKSGGHGGFDHIDGRGERNSFWGRKHSEEFKERLGKINAKRQKGKNNSQYGTCWVYKGTQDKRIKKTELNDYLSQGYVKGRVYWKVI